MNKDQTTVPADDAADIEQGLKTLVTKVRGGGGNGSNLPPATNAIMDACLRAADIVRAIPGNESVAGEDTAKRLEEIGQTFCDRLAKMGEEFRESCKRAADDLRALRVVPKESAEQTADELIRIGEAEATRHAGITAGINDMRGALKRIANIDDAK